MILKGFVFFCESNFNKNNKPSDTLAKYCEFPTLASSDQVRAYFPNRLFFNSLNRVRQDHGTFFEKFTRKTL